MVARAITPARAVWAMRTARDAAGPAQTQPKKSTPSAAGDFTPAASRAQNHTGNGAEAFRHGQARDQKPHHQGVVVVSGEQ